jgi:hypothetical protein
MSVMTDERVVLDEQTTTDKNKQAHIVLEKGDEETAHAYVMRARFEGFPVTALCGFTWVPNKQATGLPVCPECKAIFENDPQGHGDRDDLPEE